MSTKPSQWRDPRNYDYLQGLTSPDLAWEFLRRNPDYQRDYAAFARSPGDAALAAQLRARWGLLFPC